MSCINWFKFKKWLKLKWMMIIACWQPAMNSGSHHTEVLHWTKNISEWREWLNFRDGQRPSVWTNPETEVMQRRTRTSMKSYNKVHPSLWLFSTRNFPTDLIWTRLLPVWCDTKLINLKSSPKNTQIHTGKNILGIQFSNLTQIDPYSRMQLFLIIIWNFCPVSYYRQTLKLLIIGRN